MNNKTEWLGVLVAVAVFGVLQASGGAFGAEKRADRLWPVLGGQQGGGRVSAPRDRAIALTNEKKAHLGFLLLAGSGDPQPVGDCIFMLLPQAPALFHSEPYLLLAEHKAAGEHRYRFTASAEGDQWRLAITSPLERALYVTMSGDGWGEWGVSAGGAAKRLGYSHIAARGSSKAGEKK